MGRRRMDYIPDPRNNYGRIFFNDKVVISEKMMSIPNPYLSYSDAGNSFGKWC